MLLTRADPSASQPPSTFAVMPGGTLSAFEHVEWVAPAVVKKQRKRLAVYSRGELTDRTIGLPRSVTVRSVLCSAAEHVRRADITREKQTIDGAAEGIGSVAV